MGITGIVLAGGLGSRMDGVDKGLMPFRGKPLIAHALARLAPQVDEILISANRNLDRYSAFGYRVLQDTQDDHPGPLAGLQRGMEAAAHPWILCVPCDAPFLPLDLVQRMMSAIKVHGARVGFAATRDKTQPVFCLCHRELLSSIAGYLEQGGRKVGEWQRREHAIQVDFDDTPDAFININTLQELETAS